MPGLPDRSLTTVLYDADGTLFPSEEPAFEASATVVNDLLATVGVPAGYSGQQLRVLASGRSFRSLVSELLAAAGHAIGERDLDWWVERENTVVTDHLARVLRPDPVVSGALARLTGRYGAGLVSSSSLTRLRVCLLATDLGRVFPEPLCFSAQDSLPRPTSKPDPAVYRHAVAQLGIEPVQALAVEDAEAGVRSAVGAGIPVVGLTAFVPPAEKATRHRDLVSAGASLVVGTWLELAEVLGGSQEAVSA